MDPRLIHPFDGSIAHVGRPVDLLAGIEEVPRFAASGHRTTRFGEHVEPRRVESAAEGQESIEPVRIGQPGHVVDRQREHDLALLTGDEIHQLAHRLTDPSSYGRTPPALSRSGSSVGDDATRMPAASRAATLPAAVPAPPLMMAPAWPIRLPSGAVRPAMKAAIGTPCRCSPAHAAASSSAAPPISPMRTIPSVSGSAANSSRISRNWVPMIGS